MNKSIFSAAVAVMMAASAPLAMAQTVAQPPHPAARLATPAALTLQANQVRASKLIGSSVYDVQNQDIGSVKDVVLDRDGKVAAVVVDVGSFLGMGGKYVAVALADLKPDNNRWTLDMSKDQLKSAPAYRLDTNDNNTNAGH